MKLDKEQKRVLKAFWPAMLVFPFGYPLFMWIFGKLNFWRDALLMIGVGILLVIVLGLFYVLGSKIPKKDESILLYRTAFRYETADRHLWA